MFWRPYLRTGIWHIHTSYTDGCSTVAEYVEYAVETGVPLICFSEHVRRCLTYNFREYLRDIEEARNSNLGRIIILSGCEAKVLPDGSLDAERNILESVDVVFMAYHTFEGNFSKYLESLEKALDRYSGFNLVYAHPLLLLRKRGWLKGEYIRETLSILLENVHWLILENNVKYNLPPKDVLDVWIDNGGEWLIGYDAHSVRELDQLYGRLKVKP